MERAAVNPWPWSAQFGYNQGEVVEGATRTLLCAGQTAVDGEGRPQFPGDMAGQMGLALDNVETVLAAAGMGLANVVRLTVYTTDVDALLQHWNVLTDRTTAAGVAPPNTVLGVTRLAFAGLLVELEATAVA